MWLKTTQIYSVTVLEARSLKYFTGLKPNFQQGWMPLELYGKSISLPSSLYRPPTLWFMISFSHHSNRLLSLSHLLLLRLTFLPIWATLFLNQFSHWRGRLAQVVRAWCYVPHRPLWTAPTFKKKKKSFPTGSNTYQFILASMLCIPKNIPLFVILLLITRCRTELCRRKEQIDSMRWVLCMFQVVKLSTWMPSIHIKNLLCHYMVTAPFLEPLETGASEGIFRAFQLSGKNNQ